MAADLDSTSDNRVFLRGRVAETPLVRELPSGDTLVTFRLTVNRPPGERGRVDSLECVTTRPRARRTLARADPGDVLEIVGSLRRRFWRGPAGPASRYSVDATSVRMVSRAGRRDAASRDRKPASG